MVSCEGSEDRIGSRRYARERGEPMASSQPSQDWPLLEKAIDAKIEDQAEFVAWS